jgi:hypothetical protein
LVLADDLDAEVVHVRVGGAGRHQEQPLAEPDLDFDRVGVDEQLPPVQLIAATSGSGGRGEDGGAGERVRLGQFHHERGEFLFRQSLRLPHG